MLCFLKTGMQRRRVIIVVYPNRPLGDDSSMIDIFIDEMHRYTSLLNAVGKGLLNGMGTWEGGEQGCTLRIA